MDQALHQPAIFTLYLVLPPEEVLRKLAAETDQQRFITTGPDRKPFVAWIRGERFRLYGRVAREQRGLFTHHTMLHGSVKPLNGATLLQGRFIAPSYADLYVALLLVGTGLLARLFIEQPFDAGWPAPILVGVLLLGCAGLLAAYLAGIGAARKRSREEQRRMTLFLEALFAEDRASYVEQHPDDSAPRG